MLLMLLLLTLLAEGITGVSCKGVAATEAGIFFRDVLLPLPLLLLLDSLPLLLLLLLLLLLSSSSSSGDASVKA
jgi:hypothetical protein